MENAVNPQSPHDYVSKQTMPEQGKAGHRFLAEEGVSVCCILHRGHL